MRLKFSIHRCEKSWQIKTLEKTLNIYNGVIIKQSLKESKKTVTKVLKMHFKDMELMACSSQVLWGVQMLVGMLKGC